MIGDRTPSQRRWMAAAVVMVIVLGVGLWLMTSRPRIAAPEQASVRVERQLHAQLGRGAELRYAEAGQRRAVCGYVGRGAGGPAVGFVSIPNRILFSDDPLPTEFREMRQRYCPGFMQGPTQPSPVR